MKNVLLLILCLLFVGDLHASDTLTIAAASDLTLCLEDLNAAFKITHPRIDIKTVTGSSGNFLAQIKNGAPFDVFLSADMSYPKELVEEHLADESSLTLYATGHIVLWSMNPSVDVTKGLSILKDGPVKKFAIANPDVAPYGRAAKAALVGAGLWSQVQSKAVFGENIAQTAQFVQTGNVDAGIVALSLVMAPKMSGEGMYYRIADDQYPTLEQGAVITAYGTVNPLAKAYIDFLRSKEARDVLDRYGFLLPSDRKP